MNGPQTRVLRLGTYLDLVFTHHGGYFYAGGAAGGN
jgi:hypothetical protein